MIQMKRWGDPVTEVIGREVIGSPEQINLGMSSIGFLFGSAILFLGNLAWE